MNLGAVSLCLALVEMLLLATPATAASNFFCSWKPCDQFQAQGGKYCNRSEGDCVEGCAKGAKWCPAASTLGFCTWKPCDQFDHSEDEWCNRSEGNCQGCGKGSKWCPTAPFQITERVTDQGRGVDIIVHRLGLWPDDHSKKNDGNRRQGWMEVSVHAASRPDEKLTLTPFHHENTDDEEDSEWSGHGVDVKVYPVYKLTLTSGSVTKDLSRKDGVDLMAGTVGPDWAGGGPAVQNSVFRGKLGMEALHVLLHLAIVRTAEKFYDLPYGKSPGRTTFEKENHENLLEKSTRRMYLSSPSFDEYAGRNVFEFALAMGHNGLPFHEFPHKANKKTFGKQFDVARKLDAGAKTVVFESRTLSSVQVSALPPTDDADLPNYLDIVRNMVSRTTNLSDEVQFGRGSYAVPVIQKWAEAALQIRENNQVDGIGWGGPPRGLGFIASEDQMDCDKKVDPNVSWWFKDKTSGVSKTAVAIQWDRMAARPRKLGGADSEWQKPQGCATYDAMNSQKIKGGPKDHLFMTISGGTVPYLHLRLNKQEKPEVFPCHRGGKSIFTDGKQNIWGQP